MNQVFEDLKKAYSKQVAQIRAYRQREGEDELNKIIEIQMSEDEYEKECGEFQRKFEDRLRAGEFAINTPAYFEALSEHPYVQKLHKRFIEDYSAIAKAGILGYKAIFTSEAYCIEALIKRAKEELAKIGFDIEIASPIEFKENHLSGKINFYIKRK